MHFVGLWCTIISQFTVQKNIKLLGFIIPFHIILKTGGEAMFLYLARLLDIKINNRTTPRDWKKATVVPTHKGGDRSVAKNYRPVSLTSVVCKQMEHVIAGYIRQV